MIYNWDVNSLALTRWHLVCPLCKGDKGKVTLDVCQRDSKVVSDTRDLLIGCKDCGEIATCRTLDFDFATPAGIPPLAHCEAIAALIQIWLYDNPPSVIQQLAALADRPDDLSELRTLVERYVDDPAKCDALEWCERFTPEIALSMIEELEILRANAPV